MTGALSNTNKPRASYPVRLPEGVSLPLVAEGSQWSTRQPRKQVSTLKGSE